MIDTALNLGKLAGVSALLVVPEAHGANVAIWGLFITSACQLIKQFMDSRNAAARAKEAADRAEQEHRFALEDRNAATNSRERLQRSAETLQRSVAENTALTRESGQKADAALDAANHVNEKIATAIRAGSPLPAPFSLPREPHFPRRAD